MKNRAYSPYAREAVILLGEQIKLFRKQKEWSEVELAERAGISRATLQKVEQGDMGCAVGTCFELAALVGIPLFEQESQSMGRSIENNRDKLALMPKRIRAVKRVVKNDF